MVHACRRCAADLAGRMELEEVQGELPPLPAAVFLPCRSCRLLIALFARMREAIPSSAFITVATGIVMEIPAAICLAFLTKASHALQFLSQGLEEKSVLLRKAQQSV